MDDTTTTLSERAAEEIRAMLGRKRISGRELSRKLGVSQAWVSYRLTGHQEIGLNDLERIAAALEVSVSDLMPAPARRSSGGGGLNGATPQGATGQRRHTIRAANLTSRTTRRRASGRADLSQLHAESPLPADRPTADRTSRRPSWTCQAVSA